MENNTQRLERTEKVCTQCKELKPISEFCIKLSRSKDGRNAACRTCERNRREENKEKLIEWRIVNKDKTRGYTQKRIASGDHKINRRVQRHMQKGLSRDDAMRLAIKGPQKPRQTDIETAYDRLATQNAKQAWFYWITHKASNKWLEDYWKDAPWKRPGISEAEKFRLRYRNDPEFCIQQRMRAHMRRRTRHDKIGDLMRDAIKRNGNSNKVESLLGYTIADLRKHLESQFTYRMNWDRFAKGDIHIDHILPISSFDFEEIGDREWKACWALTNLRPMWAKDNLAKRDKVLYLL